MGDSEEKTEQPTEKRLEDARKDGQTVKSKELTSFCSLIVLFAYFVFQGETIVGNFYEMYDVVFKKISENLPYSTRVSLFGEIAKTLFIFAFKLLIVPVIIAASVSGFIAMVQVGGFILSPKAMEIKFDKFDIVANAKNMFSMQTIKKFIKDMIQLTVMTIVGFYMIKADIVNILNSGFYNFRVIASVFFKILAQLFLYLLLIYLVFAIIDYILERISFMKKMMMSLEEIKKEAKDSEVNQQVNQKQREIHQEMMEEESMDMTVKSSTLVVTNPTHLAIVLLYDPDKVKLPVVILKAKNHSVQLVKRLAKKHNVLVIRDVWLARQLYTLAELRKYVPSSLVAPVADIIGKYMHMMPKHIQEAFIRQTTAGINPVETAKEIERQQAQQPQEPAIVQPQVIPTPRPNTTLRKPGNF